MKAIQRAAKKVQNKTTRLIFERFRKRFPNMPAQIEKSVYQYLPGAIRVRIIDPSFAGMTFMQRELQVDDIMNALPEDARRSIKLLLLLTPKEAKNPQTGMELEFDNPTGEHM